MKSSIIIKDLIEKLSYGLYEKKQAVALSLLSAVAGESIFLLGPPGVAKSMVARRLKEAFLTGSSFPFPFLFFFFFFFAIGLRLLSPSPFPFSSSFPFLF